MQNMDERTKVFSFTLGPIQKETRRVIHLELDNKDFEAAKIIMETEAEQAGYKLLETRDSYVPVTQWGIEDALKNESGLVREFCFAKE
jgi:hypothetical protein